MALYNTLTTSTTSTTSITSSYSITLASFFVSFPTQYPINNRKQANRRSPFASWIAIWFVTPSLLLHLPSYLFNEVLCQPHLPLRSSLHLLYETSTINNSLFPFSLTNTISTSIFVLPSSLLSSSKNYPFTLVLYNPSIIFPSPLYNNSPTL